MLAICLCRCANSQSSAWSWVSDDGVHVVSGSYYDSFAVTEVCCLCVILVCLWTRNQKQFKETIRKRGKFWGSSKKQRWSWGDVRLFTSSWGKAYGGKVCGTVKSSLKLSQILS